MVGWAGVVVVRWYSLTNLDVGIFGVVHLLIVLALLVLVLIIITLLGGSELPEHLEGLTDDGRRITVNG